MTDQGVNKAIPLRQRNAAMLRLEIVEAIKEKLRSTSLENIVVKPLCLELGIAPATFFNHFQGKADVLTYFIQLWTVRLEYISLQKCRHVNGQAFLDALFSTLAQDIQEHPRLMLEIISYIAKIENRPDMRSIDRVDMKLAWPELTGIESMPVRDVGDVFRQHIKEVFKGKKNSQKKELVLFESLVSLFYGYPLAAKVMQNKDIQAGVERQLAVIWRGNDLD